MSDPERIRQLSLIADAVDQHLPPGWIYVIYVAQEGDIKGTVNVMCNAPFEVTDQLLMAIGERYVKEGGRPKPLSPP